MTIITGCLVVGRGSAQVNYHAIGMYFISRGGFALHNPQEEASLKVSAFALTGEWVGKTQRLKTAALSLSPDGVLPGLRV